MITLNRSVEPRFDSLPPLAEFAGNDIASSAGPPSKKEASRDRWDKDYQFWKHLENPNEIFRDEESSKGIAILDEMRLREPEISHCLTTISREILSLERAVAPDDPDDQASKDRAALFQSDLDEIDLDAFIASLCYTTYPGYSVIEIPWTWRKDHHGFATPCAIPQYVWRFDKDTGAPLIVEGLSGGFDPKSVTDGRFIVVRNPDPTDGQNWYGYSEGADVYYASRWKNYGIRSWLKASEKVGGLIAYAKMHLGATDEEIAGMKKFLKNLQQGQTGTVPVHDSIEIPELGRMSVSDFWLAMSQYFGGLIRKILLGSELSTSQPSGGAGSLAMSKTHGEMSYTKTEGTVRIVEQGFKKLARLWTDYNFGLEVPAPSMSFDYELREDQNKFADVVTKAINFGLKVKQAEIYERLALTPPSEGDEILQKSSAPASTGVDEPVNPLDKMGAGDDPKKDAKPAATKTDDEPDQADGDSPEFIDGGGTGQVEDLPVEFAEKTKLVKARETRRDKLFGLIMADASERAYASFMAEIANDLKSADSFDAARKSIGIPRALRRGFATYIKGAMASSILLSTVESMKKIRDEAVAFEDDDLAVIHLFEKLPILRDDSVSFAEEDVDEYIEFYPYEKAIKILKNKVPRLSPAYYDLLDKRLHGWSTTVANIESEKTVGKVMDLLARAEETGATFPEWSAEVSKILTAGELEALAPGQLQTVFRTNLMESYHAADEMLVDEVDPTGDLYPAYIRHKAANEYDCDQCDPRDGVTFPRSDTANFGSLHHNDACSMEWLSKYDTFKLSSESKREAFVPPNKGFETSPAKTLKAGIE